jgi:hypothetical protein
MRIVVKGGIGSVGWDGKEASWKYVVCLKFAQFDRKEEFNAGWLYGYVNWPSETFSAAMENIGLYRD